jgi:D-arabinose 1-dehydrogenase-like Zn-dependent alcohol dehydrogenase
MRAVQLTAVNQPLIDAILDVPEIGPADALVRVAACGICHSDAHYRAGVSQLPVLPVTPGHEISGVVEAVGRDVKQVSPGDRVCVHYLVTCGSCEHCRRGNEQFCVDVRMIGKHQHGGYAEFIKVPARNLFILPDEIRFDVGAVMMCSSATAFHALRKARLAGGESLAIFGFGGLGFSALQLAKALGSGDVYVVDINISKLTTAEDFGGIAVNATAADPVEQIRDATNGKGVDVSIDLVGAASTMSQAVRCLDNFGRAAFVGLTTAAVSIQPYPELINKEAEMIGVSDHLAAEIPLLIDAVREGKLRFPAGTLHSAGLSAGEVNTALDALEQTSERIRTVIVPQGGVS